VIITALLWSYAALLAFAGPVVLRWLAGSRRSPRLAVLAWQGASVSVVLAACLGGLSLLLPRVSWAVDVSELLRSCVMALRAQYGTPGPLAAAVGAGVVLLIAGQLLTALAVTKRSNARARLRHHDLVRLVGTRDEVRGMSVVPSSSAAAYCVPGPGAVVVLTTGALERLQDDELAAVLVHEHAHLRGRHHWVVAAAEVLQLAWPWVPLFRLAHAEVSVLVEMLADDAAARASDRVCVARALVTLGTVGVPVGTLGATGASPRERVERMLRPAQRVGVVTSLSTLVMAAMFIVAPLAVWAAPALRIAGRAYCPLP
jgi:Zn-dependent protease with chaperone function